MNWEIASMKIIQVYEKDICISISKWDILCELFWGHALKNIINNKINSLSLSLSLFLSPLSFSVCYSPIDIKHLILCHLLNIIQHYKDDV